MLEKIIKNIFGDPSETKVKNFTKLVASIREKEEEFRDFSQSDIKAKTEEFKALFTELDFKNEKDSSKILETLESIKIEAFALVVTACKLLNGQSFTLSDGKTLEWNMIPYDVQLV